MKQVLILFKESRSYMSSTDLNNACSSILESKSKTPDSMWRLSHYS